MKFRDYALAAALMIIVSGVTGTTVYDRMENGAVVSALRERLAGPAVQKPTPPELKPTIAATSSTISKKVIATTRLKVADVSGEVNSMIPLSLRTADGTDAPLIAFRLSGLPESAYLTAGSKIGVNGWLLKPGQEENVKLVVPQAPAGSFAVDVAAVEPVSGDLVSPVVEMNVDMKATQKAFIVPAAASMGAVTNFNMKAAGPLQSAPLPLKDPGPTVQLAETAQTSTGEPRKLISNGDRLMETGDIVAARAFYAKALSLGDLEAALRLGQTYDPSVFVEKKVQGLKPDTATAMHYYQQAAAAGIAEAKTLLAELQMKLTR